MKILSLFACIFLDLFYNFLLVKSKVIINCFISLIPIFYCNKVPKLTLFVILITLLFIKSRL